jgi:hypothetical protein
MIRVLAMISVAGLILSVVCLSVAVSLAGPEVVSRGGWAWIGPGAHWESHHWRHGGHSHFSDGASASANRDLAWSGGDTLDIGLPADVRFTQAAGAPKLVVRGPEDVIRHVRVDNGRIDFDTPSLDADEVTIELTAPKVTRFVVSGSGRLAIHDYRQDQLAVHITGDGAVTADGAAKAAAVEISGSGDADLAGLSLDGAEVAITGSGEAKVGPKSWAKLNISGSGNVDLLSRPRKLESQISGSGHVEQSDQEEAGTPSPSPSATPSPTPSGKSV